LVGAALVGVKLGQAQIGPFALRVEGQRGAEKTFGGRRITVY
jgi:hypothetical protein